MSIDDRSFRKALSCFASGVTVVTANNDEGNPVGVTVSAFSSLSLTPPLVLFCLDKRTTSMDAFRKGPFAINVLTENQREVSIQFASRKADKFEGIDWQAGKSGAPIINNCLASLECSLHELIEGGDHLIFVGKVEAITQQTGGQPLVYFRGAYASVEGL